MNKKGVRLAVHPYQLRSRCGPMTCACNYGGIPANIQAETLRRYEDTKIQCPRFQLAVAAPPPRQRSCGLSPTAARFSCITSIASKRRSALGSEIAANEEPEAKSPATIRRTCANRSHSGLSAKIPQINIRSFEHMLIIINEVPKPKGHSGRCFENSSMIFAANSYDKARN